MDQPIWLPRMINTDGIWEEVLKRLYHVFEKDFIIDKCHFRNLPIVWDNKKIDNQYDEGFWHLITRKDNKSKDRLLDAPRARRLPWCKPTIEHEAELIIRVWNYLESNSRVNTYIWLEGFDYLVIVQNRGNVVFLVTAFFIDGDASRKRLRVKYDNRHN